MNILLFDMDGVLLEPHGYHRALVETVRLVARALGFGEVRLAPEQIAAFESAGVYSEWDSAAICAALLLQAAWQVDPHLRLPALPAHQPARSLDLPAPDFAAFAALLRRPQLSTLRPLQRAERLILETDQCSQNPTGSSAPHSPAQKQALTAILRNARAAQDSLTHCTFQELVLGSQEYARLYHRPAHLDTPSYLLQFDRPLLGKTQAAGLFAWRAQPGNHMAIFTSRPSSPLPGVFSTPEAELGTRRIGLDGVPIAGLGGLAWLAQQRALPAQSLVKPSPVHLLAALGLALGKSLPDALRLAAGLGLDGSPQLAWQELAHARLHVFEDNIVGLQAAHSAQELLQKMGIPLELELHGFSAQPLKAAALQNIGAHVSPDLHQSLYRAGILSR